MVLAGVAGTTMANMYAGTLGVLMPHLAATLGWSRAQISASVMIVCTGLLLFGPAASYWMVRSGVKKVATFGLLAYGGAIASVGLAGPSPLSWYVAWGVVALANPLVNNVTWTTAVNRSFSKHRGLALSGALTGVGLAGLTAPPFALYTLERFGWRATYFALGALSVLVVSPLVGVLLPGSPDREISVREAPSCIGAPRQSSFALLAHDSRFWRMAVSVCAVSAAIGTLVIHLQPMMRDAGVGAAAAAGYAAVSGPAAMIARLFSGMLLDRVSTRVIAVASFLLPAVPALILLHFDGSRSQSLIAAITIGLSLGVEGDVIAYVIARYFGLRNYPGIYSVMFGLFAFGAGFAPLVAGAVFDRTASYSIMLYGLISGLICAAALVAGLERS